MHVVNKFFIFTRGRTGSTAIIDEVNSHPDCMCHGEIFLLDPLRYPKYKKPYEENGQKYLESVLKSDGVLPRGLWKLVSGNEEKGLRDYLSYIENHAQDRGIEALGFKLLHNHARENEGILEILLERGYKAIHLIRKNVVRQVVSGMLAKQRGVYNTRKEDISERVYTIDMNELKTKISMNQTHVAAASKLIRDIGFDVVEIFYEDFVENRVSFHDRLAESIGIKSDSIKPTSYKVMVPEDLSAVITNYDEFEVQIRKMGLADLIAR